MYPTKLFSLFQVGKEYRDDAEQRGEGAYFEHCLYAVDVGEIAYKRGSYAADAERETEKQTRHKAEMVGKQFL